MILFKRKFQEAIRTGAKRQTVRLWKRQMAWPGQVRFSPGVGYLRIGEVTPVGLDDLTEADAAADGFESLAALREELVAIYGGRLHPDRKLYRVTFEYLGRERPIPNPAPWGRGKDVPPPLPIVETQAGTRGGEGPSGGGRGRCPS